MEKLLRLIEPNSRSALVGRLVGTIGLIALANGLFFKLYGPPDPSNPLFHLLHAIVVGGPFAMFGLIILVYQARVQRKLSHLSRKDGLTGLNNRRTFMECTDRRREARAIGTLLLLDADHFKRINDSYGHQAGDICLQSIAETLRRNVRRDDVVGRIGGEEFAIFLCDTTVEQARIIGERLTKPISFHANESSTEASLSVTLSIGATENHPGLPLNKMLALADQALYQAKAEGRARMVVWDEQLPVH